MNRYKFLAESGVVFGGEFSNNLFPTSMKFHGKQLHFNRKLEWMFGGDVFEQFAPDFDEISIQTVAIWQNKTEEK